MPHGATLFFYYYPWGSHRCFTVRDFGIIMTIDLKASQQVTTDCSKLALGRLKCYFSHQTALHIFCQAPPQVSRLCVESMQLGRHQTIQGPPAKIPILQRHAPWLDLLPIKEERQAKYSNNNKFKVFKSINQNNCGRTPVIKRTTKNFKGTPLKFRREKTRKSCIYNFLTQKSARKWNTQPKEAFCLNTIRNLIALYSGMTTPKIMGVGVAIGVGLHLRLHLHPQTPIYTYLHPDTYSHYTQILGVYRFFYQYSFLK